MAGPAQAPAAPQGQPPQEAGAGFSDLLETGDQWFQVVGQTLQKGGAPKEVLEAFSQVYSGFQEFIGMLQGGAAQGAQGAAPMESGAAQAAPSGNMQMRG